MLNKTTEELQKLSAEFTATEICQQPSTWEKTLKIMSDNAERYQEFINKVIKAPKFKVVLTGAGTSEFIGNACYAYLNTLLNFDCASYASTDLVVAPENYINPEVPTLLISFGRSGNSPESVGAVEAVEAVSKNVYHVFITCNKDGALAKMANEKSNCLAINLPDETHDKSFAMTSSFTNMLLAVLCLFNLNNRKEVETMMKEIIPSAKKLVETDYTYFENIVREYDFRRIVYLGSSTLKGISQESALKMLELTAGKIPTMYDTPTGFRHGPKSIIDDTALTVIYLSDDEFRNKYEYDLIKEMSHQRKGNKILVVANHEHEEIKGLVDYYYSFNHEYKMENAFLGLDYIVVAQLIAIFKSLSLGITPDNPCPSGEVNRVVKGVIIYPYHK